MRIATELALAVLLGASAARAQQQPPLMEMIEVERVIVDARVTNDRGEPILGLQRHDFNVQIDGKPAEIEAVDWITESRDVQNFEDAAHVMNGSVPEQTPSGRLFVIFVQTDFGRASSRLYGQMAINASLDRWLAFLEPEDEAAVFSYDSHLRFRLDFSGDGAAIRKAVRDSLFISEPPSPAPSRTHALAPLLDRDAMRNTGQVEDGIRIVAEALEKIEGAKSMMFICWGIGHVTNRVFHTDAGYSDAVRALQRARVTVFSIDAASGHDLQGGLQAIASDTGGFYATSFPFAAITMHRLHHTLAGHYEIEVRRMPSRQHGDHSITVTVASPQRLYVMARRTFSD